MTAEKKVRKRLEGQNKPTKVDGREGLKKHSELSFFDVYDLEFEGEDKDDKITLTISGNKFAIALQASLLDAFRDLIRHELKNIKGGDSADNPDRIKRSGHPEVRLFFFQKAADTVNGYRPLKGEISFDLMEYVDSPQLALATGLRQIKEADIARISKKIREVFPPTFKWERGKKIIVYHDWARGYSFQIQCNSSTEGQRIANQVLKIQGHVADKRYLKLNELVSPSSKQLPEGEAVILGRKVKHRRYRPEGTVWYSHATIRLPSFGLSIPIG
jgi:hypothetical protein